MLGDIFAVAAAIKDVCRRRAPLHPFYVARVVGLSVRAKNGLAVPALLDGKRISFDDSYPEWRRAVGAIVCGQALRCWGIEDSSEARCALAAELGTPITDDGMITAESGPTLH